MPGPRPIDTRQQTQDRLNTLRQQTHDLQNASEENKARTNLGLNQFSQTTSQELADVISDETGSGNLVFSNKPVLNTIYLDTTSKIITANLLTGSTTVVPIIQFPLYEGNMATDNYDIVGCVEFTIQTEVGNTTGITTPTKLTKRKITKLLASLHHDYENISNAQIPSVNFVEYGNTYTTASDFAVYSVVYDSTDKKFELRVAPLLTNTMFHRVTALCTVGIDKIWSSGYIIN